MSLPSKSFDSMDATDQPLPLIPPPTDTPPGPYLNRCSPSRGGSVLAERSEDMIRDDDSGGGRPPTLSVISCVRAEAEPDSTLLCDEWFDVKYAPVMTEREDPNEESSLSAIMMAVEYDSDCVGSEDKDSFLDTEFPIHL